MGYNWNRRPLQIVSTAVSKSAGGSSWGGPVTVTKALTASSQATLTKAASFSSAVTITKTLTLSSRFDFGTRQTATTAATALLLNGISSIARKSSAGASTQLYTLGAPPVVGLMKLIYAADCTSTRTARVTLDAGNFQTTAGATLTKATFNSGADALLLVSASTALWVVASNASAVTFA